MIIQFKSDSFISVWVQQLNAMAIVGLKNFVKKYSLLLAKGITIGSMNQSTKLWTLLKIHCSGDHPNHLCALRLK